MNTPGFYIPDEVSPKCKAFVTSLYNLCVEHGVTLVPNMYDHFQLWDLRPGEVPLETPIEDRTKC